MKFVRTRLIVCSAAMLLAELHASGTDKTGDHSYEETPVHQS
jgi:hypothetical protein